MKTKKKISLLFITFVCILTMSLSVVQIKAEASFVTTFKKGVTYYVKGKYQKAQNQFNKLSKTTKEANSKRLTTAEKKAYKTAVQSHRKDYLTDYYLTDIDKDGKPELIVKTGNSTAAALSHIYTLKKGKAVFLGSISGNYGLSRDPRGNGMIGQFCRQGYEEIYTISIRYGRLTEKKWRNYRTVKSGVYMTLPYQLKSHSTFVSRPDHSYYYRINYQDLT